MILGENFMDGGAWQAIAHEVTKSWTLVSDFTFFFMRKYSILTPSLND